MSAISVYIVAADEAEAGRIARALVEERLAACVTRDAMIGTANVGAPP